MRGKKRTTELHHFIYHLESNLNELNAGLTSRTYKHGPYSLFSVNDTKRRNIAVAGIKDRFVHRLLYEYLVEIYDKTFIHDVWSCREEKKFFEFVNNKKIQNILGMRVNDEQTMWLLQEVIGSYTINRGFRRKERERERVLLNLREALPSET